MAWMFVTHLQQNSHVKTLTPKDDGIRGENENVQRYLGDEGGTFVNGIRVLIKEITQSSLAPSTHEDTVRRCHLWARQKALSRMQPCRLWSWTSQTPELWETNVSVKPLSLWYFVIADWHTQNPSVLTFVMLVDNWIDHLEFIIFPHFIDFSWQLCKYANFTENKGQQEHVFKMFQDG